MRKNEDSMKQYMLLKIKKKAYCLWKKMKNEYPLSP
jgi:hypothetical protein